ncbi:MAG TPA: hypothetical protein VK327_10835 [Candidatus Paceibacterota bacterium]|nr:hypothetical protein [Candidatus Paceibacterota bacterium]
MQIKGVFRRMTGLLVIAIQLGTGVDAGVQELYQLKFGGKSSSVNSSGDEKTTSISDRTLVRDWSQRAGIPYNKNLVLAFHRNVDSRGDAIEVVDKKTGETVTTVAPLFFPETAASTTSRGVAERHFAYVYNLYQSDYSRGTAVMNENTSVKNGVTNRFVMTGEMQWYVLPEGTNGLRINWGSLKVGKKLK